MKLAAICLMLSVAYAASPAAAYDTTFENKTVIVQDSVQVTFATDRTVYALGDPVTIFLCVENIGTQPYSNHCVSGPPDRYLVLAEECADNPTASCYQKAPFMYSFLRAWKDFTITLQPGESVVYQLVWSGRDYLTNQVPEPGNYAVLGGLEDGDGNIVMPAGGARLSILLNESGVPTLNTSWGQIKTLNTQQ